jgi:hypothetical protein
MFFVALQARVLKNAGALKTSTLYYFSALKEVPATWEHD